MLEGWRVILKGADGSRNSQSAPSAAVVQISDQEECKKTTKY